MGAARRPSSLPELLQRVRAEYEETSGLRLTAAQAERFFGIERVMCVEILDTLLTEHFLIRNRDGLLVRLAP